jgi:putative copper resistance protein D
MSGSGGFAANLVLVPEILSSTHVGKVWYIGSGALAGLLAVLLFAGRQTGARAGGAFAAFLLLIGCAKAASGHAAGQGDFTLAEVSMVLHVTGTAIWAGTVVASGFVALPHLVQFTDPVPFWSYGKLLSRTATWAVLTVLLSGIYTSDRELNGQLSGLWRTGWGRILMTKVALVLLALVLGAFARFRCVQCPATKQRAALMVRLVRAEAVVMLLILSLSGTLANTAPAMQTAKSRNQQISPSVDSRALSLLDSSSGYAGAR